MSVSNIFEKVQSSTATKEENEMTNIFTNMSDEAVEKEIKDKKDKVAAMKEAYRETLLVDSNYLNKRNSLSESLEVVNSLCFGNSGNIVVDKSKKSERELVATSQIVGYSVKNTGKQDIIYQTEDWKQDENGEYIGTKVEKTLKPGKLTAVTRQYMTMMCARPEISFSLANGKIIRGSGATSAKSVKEILESYYFRFNKDENGVTKQINDEGIKINISEKVDGKWIVKKEYVETFGYLNNELKEREKDGKGGKEKYNSQELEANYINKLIEEAGL